MTRRRWVAAAVGALLIAVAVVTTVWVVPAVFGARCTTVDPNTSTYRQEACPPAVLPPLAWVHSVPVTVEAASYGSGIEGDMHFVEATAADGKLVWYQPLVIQPEGPPAAIGVAYLPPGSYDFTFYLRSCAGTCEQLGAPDAVCSVPVTLVGAVVIDWDWSHEPCASERPATH